MRTQNKQTGAGNKSRIALAFQERFADEARFIKAWFENPVATGAVSPSGRFLSRAMARYVNVASDGPVIELGPGTGPVTQALLQRGLDPSRLILVEYDPAFCRLLERRFPGVRVVQGDAYNLRDTLAGVLDAPAAAVVSSLPLLNRPDPDRVALLCGRLRPAVADAASSSNSPTACCRRSRAAPPAACRTPPRRRSPCG